MAINVYELLQYKNGKPYLYREDQILCECHLDNSAEMYNFIKQYTKLSQKAEEHALLIGLNANNKITAIFWISKGIVDMTFMGSREIFIRLLLAGASKFGVAHNHPGGSLHPSENDQKVCKILREAGAFMGIHLVDFLIITQEGYISIL